ncbi:MAG TPA: hypothetical protein VFT41_10685 [Gemmatimonadaceae bacterium]|nr:hypothetical protein [Gemmatimonadaceae bacterium]
MSGAMRVFVNAAGVDVPRGATAADAVRAWQAAEADAVSAGTRLITDSRGLPIDGATPLQAGAILRTISNRGADAGDAESAL